MSDQPVEFTKGFSFARRVKTLRQQVSDLRKSPRVVAGGEEDIMLAGIEKRFDTLALWLVSQGID